MFKAYCKNKKWCGGRDLNPRTTKDWDLNPAQLAWLCDPRLKYLWKAELIIELVYKVYKYNLQK